MPPQPKDQVSLATTIHVHCKLQQEFPSSIFWFSQYQCDMQMFTNVIGALFVVGIFLGVLFNHLVIQFIVVGYL